MFDQIPENRPRKAPAVSLRQNECLRPSRCESVPRMHETHTFDQGDPKSSLSDRQSRTELATHRQSRLPERLMAWLFRLGEKLAR